MIYIYLYIYIDDPTACARLMNNDLEIIKQWFIRWLVSFSVGKTKSMTTSNSSVPVHHPPLYFDGEEISQVDRQTHLGIMLSSDLTWQSHVADSVSKADTRLKLCQNLLPIRPKDTIDNVYVIYEARNRMWRYNMVLFDWDTRPTNRTS